MVLKLINLNRKNSKDWTKFFKNNKKSRFEQSINYLDFLEHNGKKNNNKIVYEGKRVVGLVTLVRENFLFFKRYNSNGILVNKEKYIPVIINELKKQLKDGVYIKINDFRKNSDKNNKYSYAYVINIENKSKETLWLKNINKKSRNLIRKCEKNNLKINISKSSNELEKFYPIYKKRMIEFGSTPFNLKSLKYLLKNEKYIIFNVYKGSKILAGGTLVLENNKNLVLHLSASKKEYLAYSPNNFLYWEILKFAISKKFSKVNYGPSLLSNNVSKFKGSMGGKPILFEKHVILNPKLYFFYNLFYFPILNLKKFSKIFYNIF